VDFPHPTPILRPADEILWYWVTVLVLKKNLIDGATRPRIMFDGIFSCLECKSVTDRQTDGRTTADS